MAEEKAPQGNAGVGRLLVALEQKQYANKTSGASVHVPGGLNEMVDIHTDTCANMINEKGEESTVFDEVRKGYTVLGLVHCVAHKSCLFKPKQAMCVLPNRAPVTGARSRTGAIAARCAQLPRPLSLTCRNFDSLSLNFSLAGSVHSLSIASFMLTCFSLAASIHSPLLLTCQ